MVSCKKSREHVMYTLITREIRRPAIFIEKASVFLGWCTVINLAILLLWFLAFFSAHETMFRMHSKWFKVSRETFDAIHYSCMAFYKICIIMFNLVPLIALRIAGW